MAGNGPWGLELSRARGRDNDLLETPLSSVRGPGKGWAYVLEGGGERPDCPLNAHWGRLSLPRPGVQLCQGMSTALETGEHRWAPTLGVAPGTGEGRKETTISVHSLPLKIPFSSALWLGCITSNLQLKKFRNGS